MLASELYAKIYGLECIGHGQCHWCGAACNGRHFSDDPVMPHVKLTNQASHPSSPWLCEGCALYRAQRKQTLVSLAGIITDGLYPREESWVMTGTRFCKITLPLDGVHLAKILADPPGTLCLSLMTNACNKRFSDKRHIHNKGCLLNRLDLACINKHDEVKADTPIKFTIDNAIHTYIPWELEEALRTGNSTGTEPGTRILLALLGPIEANHKDEKKGKGRPRKDYEEIAEDAARGKPRKR